MTDPPPADDEFEPAFVLTPPPAPPPLPEPAPAPEPSRAPEPTSEPTPKPMPEPAPEPTSEPTPKPMPELASDWEPEGAPERRGWVHRARSLVVLAIAVVVLGSLAAGLVGGSLLVGYHVLDRALR